MLGNLPAAGALLKAEADMNYALLPATKEYVLTKNTCLISIIISFLLPVERKGVHMNYFLSVRTEKNEYPLF